MSDPVLDTTTPQSAPATPSAPAPAAPSPDFAAAAPATPQPAYSPAPASGAPPVEPSWLKGRLEETRRAAINRANQEFARKEAEYTARYQEMERKFNALAGVTPPADPNIEAVRQQFAQLYPGLAQLEQHAQELIDIRAQAGDLQTQNQHYWTSYGRQVMDKLFDHASQSIGGALSNEAKRQLHSSFVGYVQSSPELADRYANDPTIVEDFWKAFTSNFIDPVRRSAAANVETRVGNTPLPQDTPSGAPRLAQAPKPANIDERAKMGWTQFNQLKNQG